MDGLQAEREQGITIDVAYRFFSTDKRKFIVADTPGHEQYTRNMVTGASTPDVAVLMVDARKGVLTQTRRHSFLVSLLGIRRVDVGEYLSPGSPIVPLEQLDPIFADFSLPERELGRVTVGQQIEVSIQAFADRVFTGTIAATDPGVDTGTRNIMRFIAKEISARSYVNIMAQYRPCGRAAEIKGLNTFLSPADYHKALQEATEEGITRLDQPRRHLF